MIILIDIGNSRITIGKSRDGKTIGKVYYLSTEKAKSSDEYALTLKEMIKEPKRVVISSVVPELNEVFRDFFQNYHGIEPIFLGVGVKTGIKIQADNPKEVGGDLIANSVGAVNHYASDCLVIDLGTATTFTYIENKTIKGVIITPGLSTSRDALVMKTSLLPQVELEKPKKLLGKNSVDCIKSGLMYGHASMIDGFVRRIKNEIRKPDLSVILTGGHAHLVHSLCEETIELDKRLILKGLLLISELNA